MIDPFLERDHLGSLEQEMQQLRLENRNLRRENANLTQRLRLATPSSPADGEAHRVQLTSSSPIQNSDINRCASNGQDDGSPRSEPVAVHSNADSATAAGHREQRQQRPQQEPHRRMRSTTSSNAAGAAADVSSARIKEAVYQVKKELQEELETHRKATALEKAEKEQLMREFELFVSMACEREAGYQLVYKELYQELEEQKELVRTAQAQLVEQRVQSIEMRRSLEAEVAAAAKKKTDDASSASSPAACLVATSIADSNVSSVADSAKGNATSHGTKRRRAEKGLPHASAPRQRMEKSPPKETRATINKADASSTGATSATEVEPEADGASEVHSNASTPIEASVLKLVANGAQLRKSKHSRCPASGTQHVWRGKPREVSTGLHLPSPPTFASAPAPSATPSSSTNKELGVRASSTSAAAGGRIAVNVLPSSPVAARDALQSLWQVLAQHTEATQGFQPLWDALSALRGPEQLTALRILVSILIHLLSPGVSTSFNAAAGATVSSLRAVSSRADLSTLPPSFTSHPSSITVVAAAIRLIAVQVEQKEAQQAPGHAEGQPYHQQIKILLNSLFYRVCVATLYTWQVADGALEALEHWATAVSHLYGFQPRLLNFMKFLNTTAAYYRTRLHDGWISLAVRCIFAQCYMSSLSLPAEAAAARWTELCASVGWSAHELPLGSIERAAARCVATTRAGQGPLTMACAEEALLALRLVILYKGFDHMEQIAKLLEQPGVLPIAITKEIYAELVSLAVRDRIPFRTQGALHHALRLLREYLQEVSPERCTSAEHFVTAPRRSHVLAALALLRVDASSAPSDHERRGTAGAPSLAPAEGVQLEHTVAAASEVRDAGRKAALQWLLAQKVALEMVRQSPALANVRFVLLRDSALGHILMSEVPN